MNDEDTEARRKLRAEERKARAEEDQKIYAMIRARALAGEPQGLIAFALLEVACEIARAIAEHD